ncbi:PEP-CTERM sorting domain-containing protein [Luteolibacter flavescens]|uniref:PEP-CTERM sorting domain-containing protein n=1 Tax=Luteolibacter flavescens TaxID=1859460 RepID=A0ABT3FLE8_9BACT|nr:VIT domain-containing protein [Luteolibacter flavescens]MCW1884408.1 PEP-CTERM sorting domain-containing protein [Luteolibacter flavescens]
MKTWTSQAEKRLGEYLDERVRREGFDGEDADELKSDLRRHIHEEAEKDSSGSIGLMQLETILSRLDVGYQPPPELTTKRARGRRSSIATWTFGVVMPLLVVILELISSFCGGVFFDPIPTWWHALLILLVPGVNAWLLKGAPGGRESGKGFVAGLVLVVSAFYALLFLPLAPLSAIALIFFGFGILSLTPIIAGIVTWRIGRGMRRESADAPRYRRGWRVGFAIAVVTLVALEGPALWTRSQLATASGDGDSREAAIERLRTFHSSRTLLRACYERNGEMGRVTDIAGWIERGWEIPASIFGMRIPPDIDPAKSRDVFFRVTGKPFTSVAPPRTVTEFGSRGSRGDTREWEFDDHVGSDDVAVRLKNLDMTESRFDGHVDPRSRLGYGEWTMVFHNRAANAQEARCQVLLPRGGRVSRLTLWVNGEEREAAFNAVSKVKAAYKAVAVVQRRDPVLVTMCGPDTVMVQCFPVPAGGDMKIRFGITAPLDGDLWEMPRILERNFGLKESLEHSVWMQSEGTFDLLEQGAAPRTAAVDGPGRSMALSLPPSAVSGGLLAVKATAVSGEAPTVWCEDKFSPVHERYLVREPKKIHRKPEGKLLVVIDGSVSMEASKPWLLQALNGRNADILLANDGVKPITVRELRDHRFTGGRDNEPALREAVRRAKSGEVGEIVWLHGPQAVGLSQAEALLQLIERGTRIPVIHEVMAAPGPNRLAEALQSSGAMRRGPALLNPLEDLSAFLDTLGLERDETAWHWRRSATPPTDLGNPVWDHLARQWAMESIDSPLSTIPEIDRPALAARYQLVTRVSGAVVLETMEQFKQHGLEPVDASSVPQVPNVPEPSTAMLVMLGTVAAVCRRRREKPTPQPATPPAT